MPVPEPPTEIPKTPAPTPPPPPPRPEQPDSVSRPQEAREKRSELREWLTLGVLTLTFIAAGWYAWTARNQLNESKRTNTLAATANAATQALAERYMKLSEATLDKVAEGVTLNKTTQRARLEIIETKYNGPNTWNSAEVVIENRGGGTALDFHGSWACAEVQTTLRFPPKCRKQNGSETREKCRYRFTMPERTSGSAAPRSTMRFGKR